MSISFTCCRLRCSGAQRLRAVKRRMYACLPWCGHGWTVRKNATDGSNRLEAAAKRFFEWFTVPRLQPVGLAVTELPEPAALSALSARERAQLVRHIKDAAGRWAREAKPLLVRPGIRAQARAVTGRAATAIVEEANRSGARLIVLSSRGVASPAEPPMGSTALQVAHRAPCSVFIVRAI